MPEIMALRAQILDNLEMLEYPQLEKCRFVLMWDSSGNGQWTVFLDRFDVQTSHKVIANEYHGKGNTREEAYREMLKQTAHQLADGYLWTVLLDHLDYMERYRIKGMVLKGKGTTSDEAHADMLGKPAHALYVRHE